MKNLIIGIIALLLIVLGGFYMKKYKSSEETTGQVQQVKWQLDDIDVNKTAHITFQLQDKKGNEIRGVNDHIRIFIVDKQLAQSYQMRPTFAGNGSYKTTYQFKKEGEYTIFLYEEIGNTTKQFAEKNIIVGNKEEKKQRPIAVDSVLTKNIGTYKASLLFRTLHPNEEETLTFQFQMEKGQKLKFRSNTGERAALRIVDEKKQHFLYVVPVNDEGQLQFRVTFPSEGIYKIWGTFYINGEKYEEQFVLQVQKRKDS
ncbi:hypothetical protein BACCIP111899_00886 [Bacillus rhizoplanae]|uniref:YtkA-like domain-containing protein n=1 Tax=Bacillus rhizoplanae TaxID=2880966 RepID=A0ABM8Y7I0_9BACI|nr:hypothetical protein [Bacillus rhizoplanae]CAG9611714.1 hypothetical protein BACCIP111899_00886 [Bacillus rhizoplanae]